MIQEDSNLSNLRNDSEELEKNSPFLKEGNSKISQSENKPLETTTHQKKSQFSNSELNRIKVFKHIEKIQPTTIYRVSKNLEIAYTTVSYIVRDLIFAGVVSEQIKINDNNQAYKELTIPVEEKNE